MPDVVGEPGWGGYLHGRLCPCGAYLQKRIRYGGRDSGRRYYECDVGSPFFVISVFIFGCR